MDEDRLRVLDDPRCIGQIADMLGREFALQRCEVSERSVIRSERGFDTVLLHPLHGPVGVCGSRY